MKKNKKKYLYNKATHIWGTILIFWILGTIGIIVETFYGVEENIEYIPFSLLMLIFILFFYVLNRRKSRRSDIQAKLQKEFENETSYEAILADMERLERIKKERTANQTKGRSNVGKNVAVAGILTVYGGARVISGLVKPYMGGKKSRSRKRGW